MLWLVEYADTDSQKFSDITVGLMDSGLIRGSGSMALMLETIEFILRVKIQVLLCPIVVGLRTGIILQIMIGFSYLVRWVAVKVPIYPIVFG